MNIAELKRFYNGKKVLVTGHTGFKGSYLSAVLSLLGAKVYGYALPAPSEPSLFEIMFGEGSSKESRSHLLMQTGDAAKCISEGSFDPASSGMISSFLKDSRESGISIEASCIGDIRDFQKLKAFYDEVQPELVLHLAAQPIVRESYRTPHETYETNVMGTVNLLECLRLNPCCRSFLNVTTDKVYLNAEREGYGYREDDPLDGYDPYSNSKSCSELVTHSYKASFLEAAGVAVSTARAGNVIGGGDFAKDRIIPDCVRAAKEGEQILVRNPYSTRPYQHVLEPVFAYLLIVMRQAPDPSLSGWYNVGPDDCDCVMTGELVARFVSSFGEGLSWNAPGGIDGPHEANFLKLDNGKLKERLGWKPVWHMEETIDQTVNWTKAWFQNDVAANAELLRQICLYLSAVSQEA